MMNQICGNKLQVESLMNTVFEQICIYADEDGQMYKAYEVKKQVFTRPDLELD